MCLGPLLNTGFHFNVGNWPGHVDTAGSRNGTCDWLLSSESLRASGDSEGIFLSVAHWYPPHTSCTYLMQGDEGEIVRLYFPRYVSIKGSGQLFFCFPLHIYNFYLRIWTPSFALLKYINMFISSTLLPLQFPREIKMEISNNSITCRSKYE